MRTAQDDTDDDQLQAQCWQSWPEVQEIGKYSPNRGGAVAVWRLLTCSPLGAVWTLLTCSPLGAVWTLLTCSPLGAVNVEAAHL